MNFYILFFDYRTNLWHNGPPYLAFLTINSYAVCMLDFSWITAIFNAFGTTLNPEFLYSIFQLKNINLWHTHYEFQRFLMHFGTTLYPEFLYSISQLKNINLWYNGSLFKAFSAIYKLLCGLYDGFFVNFINFWRILGPH